MKLLQTDTPAQAQAKLLEAFGAHPVQRELVPLASCTGRILAEDIRAGEDIPGFFRSTVDGYAVRAKDTAGAADSVPVFLKVAETVRIGHPAVTRLAPGQCAYVPTGGMLPAGADAVVMVEYCEMLTGDEIAAEAAVAVGENVVRPGEDVKAGEILLTKGTGIGPAQAGALAAAGVRSVPVFVPWKAAVISTGDELVQADDVPGPGQVRDINTWSLAAAVRQTGMELVTAVCIPDDRERFRDTVRRASEEADLVLTSGGSSQGVKDDTEQVLDEVSCGGVFTHGLALKPGKPTILALDRARGTLLIGLPGHPVAALTVFSLLAAPLWRTVTGQKAPHAVPARVTENIAAAPGKATCVPVRLAEHCSPDGICTYDAVPVFGKSGLITTMAGADGYLMMDVNEEGLHAGDLTLVHAFA
ncbi:molybdopterin molybdotransferase MoeA [Clostridium vitabionis]|jgi:molybdopterin molybdotransferase|uniref:molybdopterin molybdotransferase MoeA n=1 Tax=Clostridium vitabionis TaxID=2784388 RepID=UPI00188D9A01|nr:gephyrin-like molybdotransferase Glp [Clostridium vitabionis]